jgi:hypothetical protein
MLYVLYLIPSDSRDRMTQSYFFVGKGKDILVTGHGGP